MMRRAAVQAVGGYHAEFEPAEDFDLWLRLSEVGRLANLPEVLMKDRQHARSFSEQHQREPVAAGGPALPDANLHRRRSAGVQAGDYRVALHSGVQAVAPVPWDPAP